MLGFKDSHSNGSTEMAKVILAVMKQLKQLQRMYSEASMEFQPMTSGIPV